MHPRHMALNDWLIDWNYTHLLVTMCSATEPSISLVIQWTSSKNRSTTTWRRTTPWSSLSGVSHSLYIVVLFLARQYAVSIALVYNARAKGLIVLLTLLTLWRPLLPSCRIGTAVKHPVPNQGKPSFVILDIRALWHSGTLKLSPERQSARMSKITNDCSTWSATAGQDAL